MKKKTIKKKTAIPLLILVLLLISIGIGMKRVDNSTNITGTITGVVDSITKKTGE